MVQIWYKRKARPAKPLSLRLCETTKSSTPVAGSSVYGCKLRFYLSLQPLLYYNKSGTAVKITVFISVYD